MQAWLNLLPLAVELLVAFAQAGLCQLKVGLGRFGIGPGHGPSPLFCRD
jgi:hypothetical protein